MQSYNLGKDCEAPTAALVNLKQIYSTGPSIPGPTTEGATIQVICNTGYNWQDMATVKVIYCGLFAVWEFNEACLRMMWKIVL